jgi:hypothetical protein
VSVGVKCNRPTPVTRLYGREAGVVEPALIEEVSRAVRTSGTCERRNRVNHQANVLCPSRLFQAMPWGCHGLIIVRLRNSNANGAIEKQFTFWRFLFSVRTLKNV